MQDTAQLIAIILLAAFGIERVTAGASFALEPAPDPDDKRTQRRHKLLLAFLGGAIALAIIDYGGIRILRRLQPDHPMGLIDYWLTWLVVFAGSDRVKEFLGVAGGGGSAQKKIEPIVIEVDKSAARPAPQEVKPSCAA
jgi:hypothetical protein